jgi:hypothetical protein
MGVSSSALARTMTNHAWNKGWEENRRATATSSSFRRVSTSRHQYSSGRSMLHNQHGAKHPPGLDKACTEAQQEGPLSQTPSGEVSTNVIHCIVPATVLSLAQAGRRHLALVTTPASGPTHPLSLWRTTYLGSIRSNVHGHNKQCTTIHDEPAPMPVHNCSHLYSSWYRRLMWKLGLVSTVSPWLAMRRVWSANMALRCRTNTTRKAVGRPIVYTTMLRAAAGFRACCTSPACARSKVEHRACACGAGTCVC